MRGAEARWLSVKMVPAADARSSKAHISIPKKVVRLATRRNRLKRLLREALRESGRPAAHEAAVFYLRVHRSPAGPTLAEARAALAQAMPPDAKR